jgi:hypothetical protein
VAPFTRYGAAPFERLRQTKVADFQRAFGALAYIVVLAHRKLAIHFVTPRHRRETNIAADGGKQVNVAEAERQTDNPALAANWRDKVKKGPLALAYEWRAA